MEEGESDSRKVKHEKGMSDLLLQLQEERNQVAEFTTKNADLRNRVSSSLVIGGREGHERSPATGGEKPSLQTHYPKR